AACGRGFSATIASSSWAVATTTRAEKSNCFSIAVSIAAAIRSAPGREARKIALPLLSKVRTSEWPRASINARRSAIAMRFARPTLTPRRSATQVVTRAGVRPMGRASPGSRQARGSLLRGGETLLAGGQALPFGEFPARRQHRRTMFHHPGVERAQRHQQVATQLGQVVFHPRRNRRIDRPRDEPVALELLQGQREHALGNPVDRALALVVAQ